MQITWIDKLSIFCETVIKINYYYLIQNQKKLTKKYNIPECKSMSYNMYIKISIEASRKKKFSDSLLVEKWIFEL